MSIAVASITDNGIAAVNGACAVQVRSVALLLSWVSLMMVLLLSRVRVLCR